MYARARNRQQTCSPQQRQCHQAESILHLAGSRAQEGSAAEMFAAATCASILGALMAEHNERSGTKQASRKPQRLRPSPCLLLVLQALLLRGRLLLCLPLQARFLVRQILSDKGLGLLHLGLPLRLAGGNLLHDAAHNLRGGGRTESACYCMLPACCSMRDVLTCTRLRHMACHTVQCIGAYTHRAPTAPRFLHVNKGSV